jgi:prepilin-type N-terminal cleavage/methylation domain-containing protein
MISQFHIRSGGRAQNGPRPRTHNRSAFTLIELLVVIAIIAILAGLILTVNSAVSRNRIKTRARAELTLVGMAIDNYQSKMGHYPPDNVVQVGGITQVRPELNPLYFELLGTTNFGLGFRTLDGSAQVMQAQMSRVFGPGVSGFMNCSGRRSGDEGSIARRFLNGDLKPSQIGSFTNFPDAKFLLCSIPAPYTTPNLVPANGNLFHYVSSNPTNNPNSYDLWVDVMINGKTNRICNWRYDRGHDCYACAGGVLPGCPD